MQRMKWLDVELSPAPKKLRQFSAAFMVFFLVVAVWNGVAQGHVRSGAIWATVAIAMGLTGLLKPAAIAPIFIGWMIVTFPIRWTVSKVVLALLFYLVFTPLALLFRVIGRDALNRHSQPDTNSYWTNKQMPADVRRYFEQS